MVNDGVNLSVLCSSDLRKTDSKRNVNIANAKGRGAQICAQNFENAPKRRGQCPIGKLL